MSTSEVPLPTMGPIDPTLALKISVSFVAIYLFYGLAKQIYVAFLGPLSKFPGPKLRAFSIIPMIRTMQTGNDNINLPALHEKYGPIVRTSPNSLSFAEGAQAWKDIYGFRKAGRPALVKDRMFYGRPINKVDSIITADDANHSRQRKILSNAFSDRALKEQEPMIKHWAEKLKNKLHERAQSGEDTDMLKMYNCTTFDVMGDLTFNEGLGMLDGSEYSPWVKSIFAGIKAATFIRGIKIYNRFTRYLVDEWLLNNDTVRRKQLEHWNYSKDRVDRRLKRTPERPDLWTKILEKSEGPDGLILEEHHSIASLFMVAGTETTATALSGTTYHLLQNPDTMKKLTEELRANFETFDDLNLEALAQLKYLMAVLHEGLRMYPPVPISLPRVVPEGGAAICGEFVPQGTSVGVHQYSTYMREQNFKKPYEFHPERWLGDPEFKDDHLDALEPFSVGPRNCLGKVRLSLS